MGNRRQRRQDVLILTETNSAVDSSFDAEIGYAVSPSTFEAWGLNSEQQAEDEKTGKFFQVVSERDYRPLQVFDIDKGKQSVKILGQNVDSIASQAEDEELMYLDKHTQTDKRFVWLTALAFVLALILTLIITSNMESCNADPLAKIGGVGVLFFVRRFLSNQSEKETVNAMVFRDSDRKRVFEHVNEADLPRGSRTREHRNKSLYILNRSENGKYHNIKPPEKIEKDKSPKDLYQALNCEEEVQETYGLEPSTWEKVKTVGIYAVIGVELFMIFIFGVLAGG